MGRLRGQFFLLEFCKFTKNYSYKTLLRLFTVFFELNRSTNKWVFLSLQIVWRKHYFLICREFCCFWKRNVTNRRVKDDIFNTELLSSIICFSIKNCNFYPFSSEQFRVGMRIIGAMAEHPVIPGTYFSST